MANAWPNPFESWELPRKSWFYSIIILKKEKKMGFYHRLDVYIFLRAI